MIDDPRDHQGGISFCPSAPHRAVLGLVRAALGRPVGPALARDLSASDPQDIVQIATFNYVHAVVASGFKHAPDLANVVPGDLVIYFREMQAANQRRNEAIVEQMRGVGAALTAENVQGVVLKGGAELLDPLYPDIAFRFLSDLDILVPAADIDRVAARFQKDGAVELEMSDIDSRDHHHAAPLARPDWPVQVELHRSLGQAEWRDLLAPDAFASSARPSEVPGLAVPSSVYRLAHAVQHAQLQPPRYRDGQFSVRDAMELEVMLAAMEPGDVAQAYALFDAEGRAAWEALAAAAAFTFGDAQRIAALPPVARRWAKTAVVGFGRPGRRRLGALTRWAGWYAGQLISNPERRRHYLEQLKQPRRLRRVLADQRERWRRTR